MGIRLRSAGRAIAQRWTALLFENANRPILPDFARLGPIGPRNRTNPRRINTISERFNTIPERIRTLPKRKRTISVRIRTMHERTRRALAELSRNAWKSLRLLFPDSKTWGPRSGAQTAADRLIDNAQLVGMSSVIWSISNKMATRQCDATAFLKQSPLNSAITSPLQRRQLGCYFSFLNTRRAAAMVSSITPSSCCAETNPASNAAGAKYTPSSSMAWKNALKRVLSPAIISA